MIKSLFVSLFVLAFGLVSAVASEDAALSGKVIAIEGSSVQIEVTGDLPVWAKKGGYLRATMSDGKLLLRGAKITGSEGKVITITTTKAKEMKVGDVYTLGKGKASAGC
jgi:hypothetical protein